MSAARRRAVGAVDETEEPVAAAGARENRKPAAVASVCEERKPAERDGRGARSADATGGRTRDF